jgi:hypothetical protein
MEAPQWWVMSRVQALALAVFAAVVAWTAARVLGADSEPRVPAPIVVEAPSSSDPSTVPGSSSTTGPSSGEPTIVPPPTEGPGDPAPTVPSGVDDDDDDGGGEGQDDGDDGGSGVERG